MSVIVQNHLVDDLAYAKDPDTDERADETLRFGIGRDLYEIDLNDKNAQAFRRKLEPYIKAARRLRTGTGRPRGARQRSLDIRGWAKDQGITISERGRIPASVIERYEAAGGRRVA